MEWLQSSKHSLLDLAMEMARTTYTSIGNGSASVGQFIHFSDEHLPIYTCLCSEYPTELLCMGTRSVTKAYVF